jgi:hypothetical protein
MALFGLTLADTIRAAQGLTASTRTPIPACERVGVESGG